jgi:small subunit ribosomal protein S20
VGQDMPNIKSAAKRLKVASRQRQRNVAAKSYIKTVTKRFDDAVLSGNQDEAQTNYKQVVKALDKAVSKGFLHKNNAGRKKSRYSKRLKAVGKE